MDTDDRGGFYQWDEIPAGVVSPQITRQIVSGRNMMVLRLELKKGAVVEVHHHPHEQITYVLAGKFEFDLSGQKKIVEAGEVIWVPGDIPHALIVLEDTVNLEIFCPRREEFLIKHEK